MSEPICTPYIDCENTSEGWESLFRRLIVEQEDGSLALRTACCETTPTPPVELPLILTFDDIANAALLIGGDVSLVADWNTFFDLPTNGTPFTSVEVVDDTVKLYGGSGITILDGIDGETLINFGGNTNLLEIIDNAGCVVATGYGSFCACVSITKFDFPVLTTAGNNSFQLCISAVTFDLPLLETAGDNCFSDNAAALTYDFPSLTTVGATCFISCTSLITCNFPLLLAVPDYCFQNCASLTTYDLSSCTALGTTTGDDNVFSGITGLTIAVTCDASLLTCDGGQPDGDLCYLIANNTVTINGTLAEPCAL